MLLQQLQSGQIQVDAGFRAARAIVRRLRSEGFEAYLAGGCVRDLLLGRVPKDYDVATSATPDAVLNLFPRTFSVGAHFGVVLVAGQVDQDGQVDQAGQVDQEAMLTEVATFRTDGAYSDGRRPDEVLYTASHEDDVKRRDFTINGLLLDPDSLESLSKDAVIDHVGGIADLEAGLIRAIGTAALRFAEDRLRMLRAIRLAARFSFAIDPATFAAIQAQADHVTIVSNERIRDELTRMLTEGHARNAFELLDESGLLTMVLPEIATMKGVQQPPQYHPEGDVWIHTLKLIDQLEAGCSMTLAWGALLHDVGKPATYQPPFDAEDRIRFNGHVEVGVSISAEICRRLRFSNEETAQILALVKNHMRFGDTGSMKTSTLKRFFRLDLFPEHLALHRMDCMASSGNLDHYDFAKRQYESMPADQVRPAQLLTGRELIAEGYLPGPEFKTMLHAVEEAQLEGQISTPEEAMLLVRSLFARGTDLTAAHE